MEVSLTILAGTIPADLLAMGRAVKADMDGAVFRTGAQLRTKVRAGASGRPGPRVQTGDYRRSISQTNTVGPLGATALVATNRPQGRRLEYGFTGQDSAGRFFDQPPYPHWRPAAADAQKVLEREARRAIAQAITRFNGKGL